MLLIAINWIKKKMEGNPDKTCLVFFLKAAVKNPNLFVKPTGGVNAIFILLQENNPCITMRFANEINHQPAIHTY